MTVTFYSNFSKRKNSTKQPSGGTQKTVRLKEGTSIEKPTFLLTGSTFSYNYVQAFGHYYFVDDIRAVRNDLTEYDCSMDSLATHKSAIGSYTAFVERSGYASQAKIPDPLVVMLNDENVLTNVASGLSVFASGGIYILSVINEKGSHCGFTSYYMISAGMLELLARYCTTSWNSSNPNIGFTDWLQSTFLKTFDSVIDCIWVPFSLASVPSGKTTYETLNIGVDDVYVQDSGGSSFAVGGYRFTDICVGHDTITVDIPHTYTDFRKGAPYSIGRLFIPGYGTVEFNPLDFDSDDKIYMAFDIDYATGDVACFLKDSNSCVVASYTYNVAVQCPIGRVGADAKGTISGIFSTAGGVAATVATHGAAAVASGLGTTANAINSIASAAAPTVSVKGGKGGRALANHGLDPICTVIEKITTDPLDLNDRSGRPLMGVYQLSNIPGYIKCADASISIDGMGAEKDEVNSFLNNGFYYE